MSGGKRKPSASYRRQTSQAKIERGRKALAKYYASVSHIRGSLVAAQDGIAFVAATDKKGED